MKKSNIAALAIVLSMPGLAAAQALKDQIVGTWKLVSIYNEQDGKKTYLFSEKPVGMSMYDKSGNYMSYIEKLGMPKFAVANRQKGTDAEYKAVSQGMVSGFGTYTVEGDKVTIKFVGSSYPNRAGTTETRTYKIVGDELTVSNPAASSGGTSISKSVRVK